MRLFLADYPKQLTLIRQAIESDDAQALQRAAHTLKGSAANFSATAVASTANDLEEIGRSEYLEHAQRTLKRLEQEIERLDAALQLELSD